MHSSKKRQGWSGPDSVICRRVDLMSQQCLSVYREQPLRVTEDANIEQSVAQGGYGRRQLYELVQNGADALLESPGSRIHVILTNKAVYCANEGEPIDTDGVDSILLSHMSNKRGLEIGRYGLGFKSVLGVTTRPRFYSRSGSFGFDAQKAADIIRSVVPDARRFPILRIAFVIDPRDSARNDECLAELMEWADTVVELPIDLPDCDWLSNGITGFPAEFLLFCPHVGTLILEDRNNGDRREIRVRKKDRAIFLEDGTNSSVWKVFEATHSTSAAALKDAGELAKRECVPVMWAVPLKGRVSALTGASGQFWAFFPTNNASKLSGIINAPWKTNQDRQNLLTGAFNDELIGRVAQLVVENLAELVNDQDPGQVLDFLPGRREEYSNWADDLLNKRVFEKAAIEPSLPDMNGRLRKPTEIRLHPAGMPPEALGAWKACEERSDDWCHHSVETATRRFRVERLMLADKGRHCTVREWLEALVETPTPEGSLAAVITAAKITSHANSTSVTRERVEQSRILLDADGVLAEPRPGAIFILAEEDATDSSVRLVHSTIASNEAGRDALDLLGITEVDASSELQAFLTKHDLDQMNDSDWSLFWRLAERTDNDQAIDIIRQHVGDETKSMVHVRTISGRFHPINKTLLPGPIVPDDGSRDGEVAIDLAFHEKQLPILTGLGVVDAPRPNWGETTEPWFEKYHRRAIDYYLKKLPARGPRPQKAYLVFGDRRPIGPLQPIFSLSEEGRARLTENVLLASADEKPWSLYHETSDTYPVVDCKPPQFPVLLREGRLRSSLEIERVGRCVGRSLQQWERVMPVADCIEDTVRRLDLPSSLQDLKLEHWNQALERAEELDDIKYAGKFYAEACRFAEKPTNILCCKSSVLGLHSPDEVTIVSDISLCRQIESLGQPYIVVPSGADAEVLIKRWGLRPPELSGEVTVQAVSSGPETPICDRFLGLSRKLTDEHRELCLVPCSSLRLEVTTSTGTRGEEIPLAREGDTVYFSDRMGNESLLDELVILLGTSLTPGERRDILENRALADQRERTLRIRSKPTPAEKLLEAIGFEAILRRLPSGFVGAAREKYGDLREHESLAAELVLDFLGVETLRIFKDDLQAAGFEVPVQWAGSNTARKFVRSLGFAEEFAGFQGAKRDSVLEVDGPPDLPPLHDFQEGIVGQLRELLGAETGKRGLLSLPTGAGKTRVVVESLVRSVRDDGFTGPVLWVAQSDELCEQAVQAWSEVWRAFGPRSQLHINRLWASNEADMYGEGMQVVVATIDKLQGCIDDSDYDWLKEPSCLVIDEAHCAITTEYTSLLNWLGLGRRRDSRPLVGLTATPFRGGEESTMDLVNRFFGKRLDDGILGGDPYAELQDMGVLARVDHELLDGVTVILNPEELEQLQKMRSLPGTARDRVGEDSSRNETLLKSVMQLPSDWPVLLFAASVNHARTMAAMLNHEGIKSAAISGETERGARRYCVEQFRHGNIRVLTNYAVLTAGFDAPATRAIYVARPTFSPGLYQQMIGRGLRGPLNGGKERCLIVNVRDNFDQYGERLAFTEFEPLWKLGTHQDKTGEE